MATGTIYTGKIEAEGIEFAYTITAKKYMAVLEWETSDGRKGTYNARRVCDAGQARSEAGAYFRFLREPKIPSFGKMRTHI